MRGCPRYACKFSPDKQAVLDLAKDNKNGLSMQDAESLWEWAQEYGISGHGSMSGHGKMWQGWHANLICFEIEKQIVMLIFII